MGMVAKVTAQVFTIHTSIPSTVRGARSDDNLKILSTFLNKHLAHLLRRSMVSYRHTLEIVDVGTKGHSCAVLINI